MRPVFPAQRRAEQFDSLVEGTSTGRSDDARYAELLEVVHAVRSTPRVEPRAEFVSNLREQLMAEAATALVPAAVPTSSSLEERLTVAPRRTPRERRLAAAVGGVALVGATSSMALAAQSAVPGDVLYPVKRAIENARSALDAEAQRGPTLLAQASGRLAEVGMLSQSADADTDQVNATLVTFAEQATEASDLMLLDYEETGDPAAVEELRDFTASSLDQLTQLEPLVPEGAREALLSAAQVLFTIDQAAQQACPSCGGTGITDLPAVLLDPVSAVSSSVQVPQRLSDVSPGTILEKAPEEGSAETGQAPVPDGVDQPATDQAPASGGSGSGSGGSGGSGNPLKDLTDGLTGGLGQGGGGGTESSISGPKVPEVNVGSGNGPVDLDDVVEDAVDDVGGLLSP